MKSINQWREQQHDDSCGCGHDHGHKPKTQHEHEDHCGCGHDHGHEHKTQHDHDHEDHCDCGHDHGHEHKTQHDHDHDDHCDCGHDHGHEHKTQHDHDHEDHCDCGHDHGHEHTHDHDHEDHCDCGHDHGPAHPDNCQCELCHPHAEYCDVCGLSLASCTCAMPDDGAEKKVYILENLGCANCAAKMEKKIKELPGVAYATITYTTKQLRLSADNHAKLLPQIQKICADIEPDVKVVPRTGSLPGAYKTKTYLLENLGCANCAAKMETRILAMPEVQNASITYTTKQLRLTAKQPERLIPQIKEICNSIESGIEIVEKDAAVKSKDTLVFDEGRVNTKKSLSENTKSLIEILIGSALFIAALICERLGLGLFITLPLNIVAYLILGGKVVLKALRNLTKGQIFDENFLMSIATLGAFIIKQYPEAVGVMLFYRIGEYFEHRAVEKSRSQIMDAVDLRPETVNLIINDQVQVIPAQDAQVGDILLVRPGDRIPLDSVVLEGESRIDTSPITGEPVPVKAAFGDEVTSGCLNTSGQLKIRVEKPLADSMVTRILDSVENAAASKPKIDRFITRFSRIYTPVVVFLAIATAVVPSLFTGDWNYWIYTALTFLVMSCPCALVLSVPLAFFSGIGAGSKKGILFKGGVSLEALKDVSAVVMDKTGTITEGNFILQEIVPSDNRSKSELLQITASCEQNSTHPIAVSIVNAAKDQRLALEKPISLEEIAGHGIHAVTSFGDVLCGNQKLMDKYNINMANYRKTAFGAEVLIAVNNVFAGYILISDTIKKDAKASIAQLKKQNIVTAMLTGDAEDSAQAVAKETGIDEVYAKLLPEDKLTKLQSIREKHGAVMFVGDGINDAPVLAGADVGSAMGSGADAAIEAADVVYMTSNMSAIPASIKIAKKTARIAWQNVVFALTIKVIVMILGLCGFASMWMAVFADTGVAMLCILNSIRILYQRSDKN